MDDKKKLSVSELSAEDLTSLCQSLRSSLRIELESAKEQLVAVNVANLEPMWRRVAALADLERCIRTSDEALLADARSELSLLIAETPPSEAPTLGRCHHSLGVLEIRAFRFAPALSALTRALGILDEERAST
ncbi:MAG: hypothetical protein GY811_30385 [Myxococcales bacterium]|nr:hypothetical protein [Myxococcales bacterium]